MKKRIIAVLLAMGMAASSCGGADSAADSSSSTSAAPTTTTTQPATRTTSSTTTTTTTTVPLVPPAAGYVVVDASIYPAEALPESGGAGGSGCAPGPGPLPDGIWYGTVLAADQDSVEFDLACFYFGAAAYEVGAAAGEEVNNDYFIVNDNPTRRSVPVGGGAMVWSIPGDLGDLVPLSFATDWPPDWARAYAECPGEGCRMWLYVNQGLATELVEQYTP